MIRKITSTDIVLKMILVFLLLSSQMNAQFKILNNGQRRIGNGVENSINSSGNMQQPFYYNSSLSAWRKLTFSTYPLDIRWGVGGDGTNNWNINGDMQENPLVSNPVYDYSGFTTTNAVTGDGYGVIKFSGNITINSQLFLLENTYTLLQPDGFFRIKVKITNLSGSTASNVRLWVGTRDDWVGDSDGPTKERGNLVDGVFTTIPTMATQAKAIKVSSGTEAILFFSNSPRAYSTINDCCVFTNATNQDPATNDITRTGDGSYATYARFNDLLPNQSDELNWYYASGTLVEIADIILKVAEAAGAVSNISYTSTDYSYSASQTGTTSYLLVPAGSTVPTDTQIEAGVNYPGGTVISSSSIPSVANVAHIYNFTDLTYNSNYTIYAVTKFFNGVSNVFSSVQTTNFATLPNDLPVGSAITNQTTCINSSLSGISLTITDAYPGNNTFTVTGSSSNTSLVPNGNIILSGTGNTRSISITPNTGISGTSTITISMTDSLGATGTRTFTVTFNDTVLPTITAPATVNATTNTACTATGVALGTPTTADNCGVVSVTNNAPTAFPLGNTTVTWTVTDLGGNTRTATQTVTVTDNINPTITAPAAVNATTNTACTATGVALGTPTTADNCSVASVTNNAPAAFPLGATTVTWTVTDSAGNIATATQVVTVTDNVNPTITAPATVNATTNTACTATGVALGTPTTADNCSVASVTNNAPAAFPLGATTVTWTVTDSAGNIATATQLVTVTDNVNPTITAPATVNATTNTACTATGVLLGTPVTADNCGVASVTNNHPSTTYPLGNTTVIWTATDSVGNTATATQIVTVTDNVNPTITAPADVVGNVNSSCVDTAVVLGTPVTADNCSVESVTNDAPTTFPLGDTTVTWTVTDGSGNTATATQLVSVGDVTFPVVKTKNAIVYLNNLGQAIATPNMIDNGTTDNCNFSLIVSPNNFVCGNVGLNNVILIATDDSGNQTIRPAKITVVDNLPPSITAPAAVTTVTNTLCGATGVILGTPITADNCFIDTPAVNDAPATFPTGITTVTWTVTDRSGNSATATQTVTVTDTENPTIATLASINVNADAGECTYASSQLTAPTTNDNCTVESVVASPASLVLGSNTVTWTATDGSGNTATSTQTVTVVDVQNPTITIADIVVSANASCNATGVNLGTPSTTDNCSVDGTSNDAPATFLLGDTTVTWTVTDGSGNTATTNQIVTVVDNQKPTVETLTDISVNADTGVCTYASSQLTAPIAQDNCNVTSVIASPASLVLGSNIVTWTATDGNGNTETSTQNVTVVDTQNPTIATLDAISVNADSGVCTYESWQLTAPTAADNCVVTSVVASPTSLDLGENTVTWTVTDGSGNTESSTQKIIVIDTQKPILVTLDSINLNADAGVCTYASSQLTAPDAFDNCSVATVSASPSSLILGENIVTWTAIDGSGNTETSIQNVTVLDTQNPTIETLTEINVNADAGVCTYASSQLITPIAQDNCSVTSVIASPASLDLGANLVTWTATDGSGNNETSTQTINVIDTQNPTIATLDAINVNADLGVCTYASLQLTAPIAADNCSVSSVVASPESLDLGENTVTWTVTDGSGLTATSTQVVTVVDAQNPTIAVLDAISVNADLGVCTYASSQLTAPLASDNCSVATVMASPVSLALGDNTVTWTATDGSGNTVTSFQTVTVIDTQKPTLVTLESINVNADSGVCTYDIAQLTPPTAADNCSVATVVASPSSLVLGVNTVNWTVTDGSGLTETSFQTVTVIDTQNPTIATLDAIMVNADSGVCTYDSAQLTPPTASDNCSVATVMASPTSLLLGTNTVTWTATDGSGLTATSTQTVTVVDTQNPSITVLDVVVCANDSCNATGIDLGMPTSTDNCSVATVTNNAPTTFPLGNTTVTWTITDGSGNTATTTQIVTVKDTTLPTITAPVAVSGNVNASCGANGVVIGNAITADNCSVASVTNDAPAIFPLGETIVTWTVTDGSGNTETATQLVTMGDTIFPVVKAKNATVYLNSLGQAIILPSMIDNGTTDNCEFTLTVSPNNLVCANVGQNNVLLIATDASGNQSFKPATITLVDNLAPIITAPSNVSATANASCSATGVVLGSPITTDNCTVDTVTNNAPATFPIGVTTVVWTVTDRSGNTATANQTVTVTESVLPIVKTKDITIQLDASGNATITAADIDNESSDNCGISTMTLSQDTFTISDIGFKTITLTVTDNSGNTSSATAQVTVGGTLSTIAQKNNTFTIYPIPFDSYINITLPNSYTEDVIYVQIYDLSGRIVYNQKHAVENHNVIISDLKRNSDGSYYINLLDGNQNVIQSKHILKKSEY